MKAIFYNQFGKSEDVLIYGEQEKPVANPGEVLIKMATSAVNPSDVKKRSGLTLPQLLDNGPIIPHSDGAGVIEAVGTGVDNTCVGERVWVYNAQHKRAFGTAAEYLALPLALAPTLPESAGFDVGACLGIPAMTAHRCVNAEGPVTDKTLLITGGAGRVGNYAIQFAKLGGAKVIASAGSAQSKEDCLAAGADLVIPHPNADTVAEIMDFTEGKGVDHVVEGDFSANIESILEGIRVGGVICSYASMSNMNPTIPFYRMMYRDLTLRLVFLYELPGAAMQLAIDDINTALQNDLLIHRVAKHLPLEQAAQAHQLIESGHPRGCVILNTAFT
ncbi:MAG: NADPH:quinone reductase [Porticoccaceae bacterium]|nr:NADPH:quinone reductase [Porticoccaceae bacterium]